MPRSIGYHCPSSMQPVYQMTAAQAHYTPGRLPFTYNGPVTLDGYPTTYPHAVQQENSSYYIPVNANTFGRSPNEAIHMGYAPVDLRMAPSALNTRGPLHPNNQLAYMPASSQEYLYPVINQPPTNKVINNGTTARISPKRTSLSSQENKHACEICGKMFDRICRADKCRNRHQGVKPYGCDGTCGGSPKCNRRYDSSEELKRHQRRFYKCSSW